MAKRVQTDKKDHRSEKRKRPYTLAEIKEFGEQLLEELKSLQGLICTMEARGTDELDVRGTATINIGLVEVNRFVTNLETAVNRGRVKNPRREHREEPRSRKPTDEPPE